MNPLDGRKVSANSPVDTIICRPSCTGYTHTVTQASPQYVKGPCQAFRDSWFTAAPDKTNFKQGNYLDTFSILSTVTDMASY